VAKSAELGRSAEALTSIGLILKADCPLCDVAKAFSRISPKSAEWSTFACACSNTISSFDAWIFL
jgi:hypothetical protein